MGARLGALLRVPHATLMLPYENATSGQRALADIQKILHGFGCSTFGHMTDAERGRVMVQFEFRGRQVSVTASTAGYAAAWLKRNPWSSRRATSKLDYERKATALATTAVYSVLRDWIKGQVTAVETGILSFEGAFLGQILLPSGKTILEHVEMSKQLPPPKGLTE